MNLLTIIILIGLSAIFAIFGKYAKQRYIHYVFKPLTMILIIYLAIVSGVNVNHSYKYLILSAFIFSLIGDIFLMLLNHKLIKGLYFFLIAHILYVFAFIQNVETYFFIILIPVLIYTTIIYRLLYDKLNKLRLPVLFYIIIISIMGWLAVNRYLNFQDVKSLCALMGGSLFLASDSVLAINRFKKQFKSSEIMILGTYFSAQLILALSI